MFHVFVQCFRLEPGLFNCFDELFSVETFILGFKYRRDMRFTSQLLNFILGEAKFAIYVSRKNKIGKKSCQSIVDSFFTLVKSRVLVDFKYYKAMEDLNLEIVGGVKEHCTLLRRKLVVPRKGFKFESGVMGTW